MRSIFTILLLLLATTSIYGKREKQNWVTIDDITYVILSEKEKTAEVSSYEGSRNPHTVLPEFEPYDPENKKFCAVTILDKVKIGNKEYKVTSIGYGAFQFSHIINVFFPQSLTEIGSFAFRDCRYLRSISLPQNIKILHQFCFYNCIRLQSVKLNEGLEIIESYAFTGDPIKKIEFPPSLIHIGFQAFVGTTIQRIIFNRPYESPAASIKDIFGNPSTDLIVITNNGSYSLGSMYNINFISGIESIISEKNEIHINSRGTTFHFGRTIEELKHNPIVIGPEQSLYFNPSTTLYVTPGKIPPEYQGKKFILGCYTLGTPRFIISPDSITKIHIGPETERTPTGYCIELEENARFPRAVISFE